MDITKHFNSQTYNTVYVIHCTKCAKLYIGETEHSLGTRFKEHLADKKHYSCGLTCCQPFKPSWTSFTTSVQKDVVLFTDNASDRKGVESHPSDKLGSRRPGGMNE